MQFFLTILLVCLVTFPIYIDIFYTNLYQTLLRVSLFNICTMSLDIFTLKKYDMMNSRSALKRLTDLGSDRDHSEFNQPNDDPLSRVHKSAISRWQDALV